MTYAVADTWGMGLLNLGAMKTLREAKGLTLSQAAEAAGLGGPSRWRDIESGRRQNVTLETLARIADALGVEPSDLLLPPPPRNRS